MKNKVRKTNKTKSIVFALLFVLCSIFATLGLINVSPTATYAQSITAPEDAPEGLLDFMDYSSGYIGGFVSLSSDTVTEDYPYGEPYLGACYRTREVNFATSDHTITNITPLTVSNPSYEVGSGRRYFVDPSLVGSSSRYSYNYVYTDYLSDDTALLSSYVEDISLNSSSLYTVTEYNDIQVPAAIKRPAADQLIPYGEDSYFVRLRAEENDVMEVYIPSGAAVDYFFGIPLSQHYTFMLAVDTVPMTAYNDGHFDQNVMAAHFGDNQFFVTHYIYIRDYDSVKGSYLTITPELFGEDVAVIAYRFMKVENVAGYENYNDSIDYKHNYSEVRYNDDVVVLTIDDEFSGTPTFANLNSSIETPEDPDPVDPEPVDPDPVDPEPGEPGEPEDPQPEDPQSVSPSIFDGSIDTSLGSTGTIDFDHYTANWIGFNGEASFAIEAEVADKAYTQAWRSSGKSNDNRYLKLDFDENVATFSVKVVAKANSDNGTVNIGINGDTPYSNALIATVGTVDGSGYALVESEVVTVEADHNYYITFSNSARFAEVTVTVTLKEEASSDPSDPEPGEPGVEDPEPEEPDDPDDIVVRFVYSLNDFENVKIRKSDYETVSDFLDALRAAYKVIEGEDIEALDFIGYVAEYKDLEGKSAFLYESLVDLATSPNGCSVTLTADWFVKISFKYEIPETVLLYDNFKPTYKTARPETSDFDPSKVVWSEEEGRYVYDGTYTIDDDPYFCSYVDLSRAVLADVRLVRTYDGDLTLYEEFPSLFTGFQQYYVDDYTFKGWKVPEFCEEYFENGYFTVTGLADVMRQVYADNGYDDILELYPNGIDVVLLADMDVSVYDPVAPAVDPTPGTSTDKPADSGTEAPANSGDHAGDSSGSTVTSDKEEGNGDQKTEKEQWKLHLRFPNWENLWEKITHPKQFFEALKNYVKELGALDWIVIASCAFVFIGVIALIIKAIKKRR